jgi:hypothetical protein
MSDEKKRVALPASVPSGTAQPMVVSEEYIRALKQVGGRPSLVAALEKERIAAGAADSSGTKTRD